MKACSSCGRAARRFRRAFVLGRGMQNVCPSCFDGGLHVTAASAAAVTREALSAQERETREVLRALARDLRGKAKAFDGGFVAEGLEMAANVAEAWAAREPARGAA